MTGSIRYPDWLEDKVDFAKDVLYQIASVPDLEPLRAALVLKGGAAILLGYRGLRASRKDLDFGLYTNVEADDDLIDALLAALVEGKWDARLDTSRTEPVERRGDGSFNIHIGFRHPETGRLGRFEIQVSGRPGTVPPRLADRIQSRTISTYDGTAFEFPVVSPEEIVVEKMFRLFDPARPARHEDLFDIGWLTETFGALETDLIRETFFEHAGAEGASVRREPVERLLTANRAAAYGGKPEFGSASPTLIVDTVARGGRAVLRLAGLDEVGGHLGGSSTAPFATSRDADWRSVRLTRSPEAKTHLAHPADPRTLCGRALSRLASGQIRSDDPSRALGPLLCGTCQAAWSSMGPTPPHRPGD